MARIAVICAVLALAGVLPGAVRAQPASPVLTVEGIGSAPRIFTLSDLGEMPQHTVSVELGSGRRTECSGVRLGDVLAGTGLPMGTALRGARLRDYLLVTAADGYAAVFALPEVDALFAASHVVLCTRLDGRPIADGTGPLRIVVPHERRHARWVRQVVRVTLRTSP